MLRLVKVGMLVYVDFTLQIVRYHIFIQIRLLAQIIRWRFCITHMKVLRAFSWFKFRYYNNNNKCSYYLVSCLVCVPTMLQFSIIEVYSKYSSCIDPWTWCHWKRSIILTVQPLGCYDCFDNVNLKFIFNKQQKKFLVCAKEVILVYL